MTPTKFSSFVLLARMRTGSNLFEQIINAVEGVNSLGELFNPSFISGPKKHEKYDISVEARDADPIRFWEALKEEHTAHLTGFRLFDGHDQRILEHVILDPTCAKIILERDALEAFVSLGIARQTGQWRLSDVTRKRREKITFDGDAYEAYLTEGKEFYSMIRHEIRASGQSAFEINYRELLDIRLMNGVLSFLGVGGRLSQLAPKIIRQNPEPLEDKVSNPSVLAAYRQSAAQTFSINLVNSVAEHDDAAGRIWLDHQEGCAYADLSDFSGFEKAGKSRAQSGSEIDAFLKEFKGAKLKVFIEHPLHLAFRSFEDFVLPLRRAGLKDIRRDLIRLRGVALPEGHEARNLDREKLISIGFDHKAYQEAFLNFLDYFKDCREARTRSAMPEIWRPYRNQVAPLLEFIPNAEFYVQTQQDTLFSRFFSLDDIYLPEMEARIFESFETDMIRFGIAPWRSDQEAADLKSASSL